ncbi:hypothetical protein SAMN05444360_10849 [Chryseobacterium carnipullorum]|nr:hypothetical protein SAMN05444360_10849 [Chryseobacterium carnipullorum]
MIFKNIHIGKIILECVHTKEMDITRICNFFNRTSSEIEQMYEYKSLESDILLKWSKLLEYDFFRIYSQHLILYSPPSREYIKNKDRQSSLPQFKKNLYTKEMIEFLLELINSGQKTKKQVVEEYKIPKTTLYKWLDKYN